MTTVKERRIINLNSQNAILNNGSFLSNVSFNFSNIYTVEDDVISLSGGLLSAQIPVSFYSVNYTCNVLKYCIDIAHVLTYYTITITTGFYDYQSLFIEMDTQFKANGHNFTLTLNENSGKMTLKYNGVNTFTSIIYNGSTCFSILGFGKMDYLATSNILIAPYPLDLLGIRSLKIICPEFATNNRDSVNLSTTLLVESIPVDQPPYGLIMYSNSNNDFGNLQTLNISSMNIQILSENGDFVNFNNANWTMTFVLFIDRLFKVKLVNNLNSVMMDMPRIPKIQNEVPQQNVSEEEFIPEEQIVTEEEFIPEEQIVTEEPEESSLDAMNDDEELQLLMS